MSLTADSYGYDVCISMWSPSSTEIWFTINEVVTDHGLRHECDVYFYPGLFSSHNLRYLFSVHIAIMVDKVGSVNLTSVVEKGKTLGIRNRPHTRNGGFNGKVKTGINFFNFQDKKNHISQHVDGMSSISKVSKSKLRHPQEIENNCEAKTSSGATTTIWRRRDSFSSCSSDSAGYCSSGNAQVDSPAQDVKLNESSTQKKRQRHSSESSALSSASESSNRGANSPRVNEILSCLDDHDVSKSVTTVSKHASITRYPRTITSQSEVSTIVEEKTLSYTCKTYEKSPQNDERHHNLRRQIRKKTCHNCDCSGSHDTVVVRKFTQIKRATTTTTTTTTKHRLPKVSQTLPVINQNTLNTHSPPPTKRDEEELQSSEKSPSTPSSCNNKKRRREVDKLYDALHEIKWAKHMSPDNILSQIDFRRAATESFYSSKCKSPSSKSDQKNVLESPQTVKGNHLTKDISETQECSSLSCHGEDKQLTIHHTIQNKVSPDKSNLQRRISISRSRKAVNSSPPNTTNNHTMSLRSLQKGKKLRNGFHLNSRRKIEDLNCKRNNSRKLNKEQETDNLNGSNKLSDCKEEIKNKEELTLDCTESSSSLHHETSVSDIKFLSTQSAIQLHNVEETDVSESVVAVDELWTDVAIENADQSDDVIHFEHTHDCVILSSVESPCVEGEVVFACLDPFIQEIETTVEMISEEEPEIKSLMLPHLTKVLPVIEHDSVGSPPHLEPCIENTPLCLSNSDHDRNGDVVDSECISNTTVCTPDDTTNCTTLTEIEYVENVVSSGNIIDNIHPEENNRKSEPIVVKKKQRCKAFSRGDYAKRSKLRNSLVAKSKTLLKTVVRFSSPTKPILPVIEKDHSQGSSTPKAISPNIVSNISGSIPVLNEEDRNALIKNDSLRVHLRELDHVVIRDQLERYNHMVSQSTSHQSVVCTRLETSTVNKNEKRSQYSAKKEVRYNRHYSHSNSLTAGSKQKHAALALEYKKPSHDDAVQMPSKFTIHYRYITVNRNDCYTQIIFKSTRGSRTYLSIEALRELKDTLNTAVHDEQCQVLIINSIGKSFCSGLDLRPLVGPRKTSASKEMAAAIKGFVEAMVTFCKPLVVVVNGEAMGLGVTMLAYSDLILASDAAIFHMPHSQLGFSPEAAATLMLPFVVGSTVAMDMMLRGRKLSAYEAQDLGLVTEVLTASRLPYKLVERVKQLSENPSSAMENTKSMLRRHLYHRLGLALESETAMLPNQWLSEPCQSALKNAFKSGFLD